MTHVVAALDQDSYAFYDNDGSEAASTLIGAANAQQTLIADGSTEYQCRLLVQEVNGGSANVAALWQYELNTSGTWVAVTTTSGVVRASDANAHITQGANTTQRIGSGTYLSANAWQSEVGTSSNAGFVGNDEAEAVLAFFLVDGDLSDGDVVELRVTDGGSALDTYTRTASIDVSKAAAGDQRIFVIS